jgi:hypothetical protein
MQYDSASQAEMNRRDAREAIGFSRNQLGEFDQSTRRTAREATFVEAGSQRRTGKRESQIVDMYIDAMAKVNGLVFDFWQVPREVLHDDGWAVITGPMLRGDYLYDVTLTTKRYVSKADRKMEAIALFGQLAQIPGIDPTALFQYLEAAAADPHFSNILAPMLMKGQQGGQSGLPAIPSTGESPAAAGGGQSTVNNAEM